MSQHITINHHLNPDKSLGITINHHRTPKSWKISFHLSPAAQEPAPSKVAPEEKSDTVRVQRVAEYLPEKWISKTGNPKASGDQRSVPKGPRGQLKLLQLGPH